MSERAIPSAGNEKGGRGQKTVNKGREGEEKGPTRDAERHLDEGAS